MLLLIVELEWSCEESKVRNYRRSQDVEWKVCERRKEGEASKDGKNSPW